ncbi:MAG: PspA/IM30 family protein [Gammaproteobacteria bacterium]|nr:PspA/IM30 family protein [Gammaproteobacteria bacterium]MDH3466732.1 PspA/IM30 family protein [Gammaproteobacteria bacterium]
MALITRVSRLFRADLHAVLDRIEEPEVLLKQAVREMEEDLSRDEQRSKFLRHERGQLMARHAELEQKLAELDQELDICFGNGKDDLARALIKRQLEAQRFCRVLTAKCESVQTTLSEITERTGDHRARLEIMRQKAELFGDDSDRDEADTALSPADISVREEDIEVAFLREKQKRTQA